MGLFGKRQKAERPAARPPDMELLPWMLDPPRHEVVVHGECERAVYTYDSRPLAAVRAGDEIVLEAFRGDATMTSVHTGYTSSTKERDDVLMLYNGQPIGFLHIPIIDKVLGAATAGYALKFKAVCKGMLEGYDGVKEIVAMMPPRLYLYDWVPGIEDDRPMRDRENYYSLTESHDDALAFLGTRDEWHFDEVKIGLIPQPEKTKTKPHIGIYTDGRYICDVSAKRICYKSLYEFASKYQHASCTATRRSSSSNDGQVYYKIELVGLES